MKIHIESFDRETNDLHYKVAPDSYSGDFSDVSATAANVPSLDLVDINDTQNVLIAVANQSSSIIDRESSNKEVSATTKDLYTALEGNNYDVSDADIVAYLDPSKDFDAANEAAWLAVEESFPVVDAIIMEKLLSVKYKQVQTAARIRPSDGAIVAVIITELYAGQSGAVVFTEGVKLLNDTSMYGVPLMGMNTNQGGVPKEDLTAWQEAQGMTAIRGTVHDYIYSAMDSTMWANRQRAIINKERDAAIDIPVTYSSHTWDCDELSRTNLVETLIVYGSGIVPAGFMWRTADNQNIPADLAYLEGLSKVMAEQKNAAFIASWLRKASLDAIVDGATTTEAEKIAAIQLV